MKVLMVNSVCGVGSTGRICTDLCDVLTKNGNEVKIAYGRGEAPLNYKNNSYKIGSDFLVKINAIKSRIFDNEGFNAKRATKRFLKWADSYNPDVLHLHNLHGYYLNVELLFKWIKSRPQMKVFWTLHDCWAFTGHCAYFDYANCKKWENYCYRCVQKNTYPKSIFKDNSKRNYKKKKQIFTGVRNLEIITPSNWLKEKVEKSFLNEYKVSVVNNGIDLSVFKHSVSNIKEKLNCIGKQIILGVANIWEERKGLNDFIKISNLLPKEYQIVLIGLNDNQIKSLPKNILGIKRTNNVKELVEIYSSSYLLFNPTYEDNYPTVNLEAQACGIPVITYKTGGSVESVPNSNVLNKGDYKGLIAKLGEDLQVLEIKQGKEEFCNEYLEKYGKWERGNYENRSY